MTKMVNYVEAIKKPFSDLIKLVIGIVLNIIPIVNFTIVKGFAIECSGLGKTRPSAKMPEWKNWTNLFMNGLLATIIQILYVLPAAIVIIAAVASAIMPLIAAGVKPEMFMAGDMTTQSAQMMAAKWAVIWPALLAAMPLVIVGAILGILACYMLPMAVLNYVARKRFSAAFELGLIAKKSFTANYFVAWLVAIVLTIIVTAILSIIPIVGPIIAAFIIPVMTFSIFGQVYRKV